MVVHWDRLLQVLAQALGLASVLALVLVEVEAAAEVVWCSVCGGMLDPLELELGLFQSKHTVQIELIYQRV